MFDCEGDGLKPTKLHCLAASNPQTTKVFVTADYDKMRKILTEADILIGHNIIRWDIPTLERLLDIKIKAKLVDTLSLSWYLYPNRQKHGLESWGDTLGIKKPFILNWEDQTQEEYEHRCVEDVKINVAFWRQCYRYLLDIYGSDKGLWGLLDYLEFKLHCARLQEKSKWKIDVEHVQKVLAELVEIQAQKKDALILVMPKVPEIRKKIKPKRFINSNGEYSKLGLEWIDLVMSKGYPIDYDGEIEIVVGYEDGNPASSSQLKDWLFSLGWVPGTTKTTKNPLTGESKEVPQINLDLGKGICKSIKKLYSKEPALELLDGLSVLQHRIGILKGFLRDQEDGWIQAQVNGLTNTLRFKHTTIVNLPKVSKLYAEGIRASLVAPDGYELCGSDMASLEDRIKRHYIFPLDPNYVKSMDDPTWDPHLEIAKLAGMLVQQQVDDYKSGVDKSIKSIRDIAKNCGYACQYGAGVSRLMITGGISRDAAKKLFDAYWELNWSVRTVASQQRTKTINDQMWLWNPVSELWYSLRFEKDIFSTLVQGTASYVFDKWIENVLKKREQLTAQFHDEGVWTVKKGYRGECSKVIKDAMDKLNKDIKLNVELGCDIQYGDRYSDIH